MEHELVRFLNPGRHLAGNDQVYCGKPPGVAAILAEQRDAFELEPASLLERAEDVLRPAAGGDRDDDVASLAKAPHLPCEQVLEAVVVADGGQQAAVGGQVDRRKGGAVAHEAADILGGEVGRVARAAAVAACYQLAAVFQAIPDQPGGAQDVLLQRAQRFDGPGGLVDGCRDLTHETPIYGGPCG